MEGAVLKDKKAEYCPDGSGKKLPVKLKRMASARANRFRKKKKSVLPKFDWNELNPKCGRQLKRLIRAAEKGLVPDAGLIFSYDSVKLVPMHELEVSYLKELANEAEEQSWGTRTSSNHDAYHTYLETIIDSFLKESQKGIPRGWDDDDWDGDDDDDCDWEDDDWDDEE